MICIKELLVTLSYMIQFAEGKIESLSRYYQLAISYRQIGPVYKNPELVRSPTPSTTTLTTIIYHYSGHLYTGRGPVGRKGGASALSRAAWADFSTSKLKSGTLFLLYNFKNKN